jgi:hypothetical protein
MTVIAEAGVVALCNGRIVKQWQRCKQPLLTVCTGISATGRMVYAPVVDMGPLTSATRVQVQAVGEACFGPGIRVHTVTACKRFAVEGLGDVRDWAEGDHSVWRAFEQEIRRDSA